MSRLMRPCIQCGRTVRGRSRCNDCQRDLDRRKAARRPDLHADTHERERRRRAVADHRAIVGDWCPGWTGRPAHPSADLTADHVKEVAAGGRPAGRLVVRCRSCNSAKAAAILAKAMVGIDQRASLTSSNSGTSGRNRPPVSPQERRPTTPRPSKFPIETTPPYHDQAPGDRGPVVA